MNNKYELDFYETMLVANEYFDRLEDEMEELVTKYKTQPDKLEKIIEQVRSNHEPLYHADDLMHIYLNSGDYQSVCNQTVIREIVYMFYRDVLPETQLDYIDDYLQSITEAQLIEDVTELIDNYKKEMM